MSVANVTVVMPAYNHEKYVGAAIESVLTQTHSNIRLIVIDDGSTDNTGAVVKAIDDPRVEYFYQDNQDAFNTLNRGLSMVNTPYAAILNSDDIYLPTRLATLIEVQNYSGAQCLFTDVTAISDQGEPMLDPAFFWNQWHQKNKKKYFDCGDLYTAFLHGNFMVTTSNLFMTREVIDKVGQFCSFRYLHDYDYMFRILLAFPEKVQYLHDQNLLHYRIHGSNTLSEAAVIGREQDQEIIRKYLLARFPDVQHDMLNTGINRLITLEHELVEARAERRHDLASKSTPTPEFEGGVLQRLKGLLR